MAIMDPDIRCRTCRWYAREREHGLFHLSMKLKGVCRIDPPSMQPGQLGMWPIVDGMDWCAHHSELELLHE